MRNRCLVPWWWIPGLAGLVLVFVVLESAFTALDEAFLFLFGATDPFRALTDTLEASREPSGLALVAAVAGASLAAFALWRLWLSLGRIERIVRSFCEVPER